MKQFNIFKFNDKTNRFESFDIIPELIEDYNKLPMRKRPKSFLEYEWFVFSSIVTRYSNNKKSRIGLLKMPSQNYFQETTVWGQVKINIKTVVTFLIKSLNETV